MIGGLMKTTSRFALAAAATAVMASGAMAADLGGNCCADLEERVAELEATTARKGNRKVSLTVYGQVNKQLMWHDSDETTAFRSDKLSIRDNDAGMSRIGVRGSAKIRPDLEAGYVIVMGLQENAGVSMSNSIIRENYVYLDSTQFGRVTLGQASQVTDGLFEINLANALVTPMGMDTAGGMLDSSNTTFGVGAFNRTFATPFDGARRQGIYYRTPTMAGFVLSTGFSHNTGSTGTNPPTLDSTDHWEVALRYAGEFNGIRFAAGVGYRNEDNDLTGVENDIWMYSSSTMHVPTGLFLSGGYAALDTNVVGGDRDAWWLMAGIERNFFGPGATTFYGEYGQSNFDTESLGATRIDDQLSGQYWGLGVVQKIDAAASDLYLQYRNYELDGLGAVSSRDASVINAGMIIRF